MRCCCYCHAAPNRVPIPPRSAATRKPDRRSPHVLHGAWQSFNGGSLRQESTSARPPASAATTLDRPEPIFLSNGVSREALVVSRGSSDSSPNAVLIAYLLLHLHFQLLGDPRARKRRVKHEDIGRSAHTLWHMWLDLAAALSRLPGTSERTPLRTPVKTPLRMSRGCAASTYF